VQLSRSHGPAEKVLMEIDVAVFTFDRAQKLTIVTAPANSSSMIAPRILGLTGDELGLSSSQCFQPTDRGDDFPGKHGRWSVSHTAFGKTAPSSVADYLDMSRACAKRSGRLWQRLIRCWATS